MMPNSAYTLEAIVLEQDYTPQQKFRTMGVGGPSVKDGIEGPIYAVLITESATTGSITLECLGNEEPVTIPCNALKVGVVYNIYLKKLITDNGGAVKMMGFRYSTHPLTL
jgi:hypothetical protein